MSRKLFIIAGLILACAAASATEPAEEARLLRFPATNGHEVAFTYAGDLYAVPINGGIAHRLTSHIGYEMFARYSPDGSKIAFTGEYDGNREVYIIPSHGGFPERVTWTATNSRDDLGDRMGPNNIVMGWAPDGSSILFRNRIGDGFDGNLWTVAPDGSMPVRLPLVDGGFSCWSPDGKKLAYNRVMREFRTWKYYRGGMADEIWVWNPETGTVSKVTENDAQDIFPMWVGDEIYFASDRDMTMNIFCYDTRTGRTEKVTSFRDFDVKFPSTDGHTIVFEQAGYIWKLDPASKKYEKISIRLSSDDVAARKVMKDVSGDLTSVDASPDGVRLAVTARGEVFDVPASAGVTRNMTRTPGANDRGACWSPDGRTVAYISDLGGETEIWLQDALDDTAAPRALTSGSDTYIRSVRWSPDSSHLIYTDRKNRMVEVDAASGTKRVLLQCPEGEFRSVCYSPDGKWITYTRPASNEMGVAYVYELATGREIAVTEKWYDSSSPVFSSDGKFLVVSCARDLHPQYSSVEWNFAYGNMYSLYLVMLDPATASPLLPKDGVVIPRSENAPKLEAKPAKDAKKDAKEEEPDGVSVKIVPEGILDRIVKLPCNGRVHLCDGKKLWYSDRGGVSVFDFATQKTEKWGDGSLSYHPGAKKAVLRKGASVSLVDFPSSKAGSCTPVDLSQLVATVDYTREWPQIFDEVWRAFRDGFYLENMHGRDWNAIKEQYSALLPHVRTRLDLNYVIGEMISELACGHAYVSAGEYPKPERIPMGLLGAEMSKDVQTGYFRIDRILGGAPYSEALRSPLREPGMNVTEGEFITAVDGISTSDVGNIYQLLVGKAGVLVELTVNPEAAKGGRKVIVKPISDEYPLYHYEWVIGNIRKVEELSGGKVGYIYIPDMGPEGLNEFVRYYYPQLDKEALIIDDRGNGGGNISPMVVERLLRKPYRMTMYRTTSRNGTIPDGTHVGPKVLLVNKYSASDGDLFPWSFKANSLGMVIGTRTWGGIIGISGSLPYMDGTDVRVPFFTNYDAKTGQWIVENHGVDPDILLENDPVKEAAGIDQQLEEAVRVALEQVKDRKAMPSVPAPRTFKDLGLPENW